MTLIDFFFGRKDPEKEHRELQEREQQIIAFIRKQEKELYRLTQLSQKGRELGASGAIIQAEFKKEEARKIELERLLDEIRRRLNVLEHQKKAA